MEAFEDMESDDQIMKPTDSLEVAAPTDTSRFKVEDERKKTRMAVLTHRAMTSSGQKDFISPSHKRISLQNGEKLWNSGG